MLDKTTATNIQIRRCALNEISAAKIMMREMARLQNMQALLTASTVDWDRSLNRNDFSVDIAYVDDKIAGMVITVWSPLAGSKSRVLEIQALYVVEQYRRRGIGTKLLQAAVKRAGNAVIRVDVRRDDVAVRAMFRAAGFLSADGFELMVRGHG